MVTLQQLFENYCRHMEIEPLESQRVAFFSGAFAFMTMCTAGDEKTAVAEVQAFIQSMMRRPTTH